MEVTAAQAAKILSTSQRTVTQRTIQRYVKAGVLPAQIRGGQRQAYIDLADLREFAGRNGFAVNEVYVERLRRLTELMQEMT